jgi:hypothetical protein
MFIDRSGATYMERTTLALFSKLDAPIVCIRFCLLFDAILFPRSQQGHPRFIVRSAELAHDLPAQIRQ